ncbi:hypothetical protein AW910_08060 [Pseudomonas aeruginosa]|nr:hypothetical protein AW910_08060 [Pseudomonas aeruginosa]
MAPCPAAISWAATEPPRKPVAPRQQDAFAGIDSGDLLTVGMHVHVFPPSEKSVAHASMRGWLRRSL